MKKHLLIAAGLLTATIIQTQPAISVTKCVKLSHYSACTGSPNSFEGNVDWFTNCNSTAVYGIAGCSSNSGSQGDTRTSLTRSATAADNAYCWCKITQPAVSKWAFNFKSSDGNGCAKMCAVACATEMTSSRSTVKEAMYDNFIN